MESAEIHDPFGDFEQSRLAAAFGVASIGIGASQKLEPGTWLLTTTEQVNDGPTYWAIELIDDMDAWTWKMSVLSCCIRNNRLEDICVSGTVNPAWVDLFLRSFYKFGVNTTALEAQFGTRLGVDECLACRAELPRKFWPPKWLELP